MLQRLSVASVRLQGESMALRERNVEGGRDLDFCQKAPANAYKLRESGAFLSFVLHSFVSELQLAFLHIRRLSRRRPRSMPKLELCMSK